MGFDAQAFQREEFEPREEAVRVDGLSAWFGEDEEPEWRVRGLSHQELSHAEEAATRRQDVAAVVDALSGNSQKKAEAILELLGMDEAVPKDTAKRMEMLRMASIEPEVDLDVAIKMSKVKPIEFTLITNKILELTGKGYAAVKKPEASGDGQKPSES